MASNDLCAAPTATVIVSRRRLGQVLSTAVLSSGTLAFLNTVPAQAGTGRIEFELVRAGFILGFGSGSGTLRFNGERHRLSIGGISLGATIGIASADFVGRARNLYRVRDIAGTYSALGAGLTAAGGGAVARLRNSRGVVLELQAKQVGFMASVDLSGLRISLAR